MCLAHGQSLGCHLEGPLLRPLPYWRQRFERLTMAQTHNNSEQKPYHLPVMVREVVDLLSPVERGVLVDATFGGGGHTRELLRQLPEISVLAIDRDPAAAAQALTLPRLRFVVANYGELGEILTEIPGVEDPQYDPREEQHKPCHVSAVLFDLGVSSHQLENPARGFSYRDAGPLDMRMGPDTFCTADTIVNDWGVDDLIRILRSFGEERNASRIVRAIIRQRPILDTGHLARVIASAVPAPARRRRHPARKTFQAIRIAVNEELEALERGLDDAIRWVRPGGRIVVITYHSLEDRIVKRRFVAGTGGCECPADLPVCTCERTTELRLVGRKILRPTAEEIASNPRARSAKLRAIEKVIP